MRRERSLSQCLSHADSGTGTHCGADRWFPALRVGAMGASPPVTATSRASGDCHLSRQTLVAETTRVRRERSLSPIPAALHRGGVFQMRTIVLFASIIMSVIAHAAPDLYCLAGLTCPRFLSQLE